MHFQAWLLFSNSLSIACTPVNLWTLGTFLRISQVQAEREKPTLTLVSHKTACFLFQFLPSSPKTAQRTWENIHSKSNLTLQHFKLQSVQQPCKFPCMQEHVSASKGGLRGMQKVWDNRSEPTDLCVQLIHNEVAQSGFEEILFRTILEQRIIHRVCSNLGTKKILLELGKKTASLRTELKTKQLIKITRSATQLSANKDCGKKCQHPYKKLLGSQTVFN